MGLGRIGQLYMRHRVTINDTAILVAIFAVVAYIAFEIDIFWTEDQVSEAERILELNEVLLVGFHAELSRLGA